MHVRQVDTAWEVDSPAKLNLYLEVLGRRDDGFHELETLMAPVRLCDHLRWHPAAGDNPRGFSLGYHPSTLRQLREAVPADHNNLVWRAAELLASNAGIQPTGHFTLTKRIPAQAGLGGGSSNAAAALALANAAWGLNYPTDRLARLAAQLGSDVPFFLAGRSAICRGRGERVEPVSGVPRLDVVIVKPPQGISTPAAFATLNAEEFNSSQANRSHSPARHLAEQLQGGKLVAAGRGLFNRLEVVAADLCRWIARLHDAFNRLDCLGHTMTGSGSAYFGVMRSARQARHAAGLLKSMELGIVLATATCR